MAAFSTEVACCIAEFYRRAIALTAQAFELIARNIKLFNVSGIISRWPETNGFLLYRI